MRVLRFVLLVVLTTVVAVAVGATVARLGMRVVALTESAGEAGFSVEGTANVFVTAAEATLPLVIVLAVLRARLRTGRALGAGLGALLIAFPGGPFLFDEPRHMTAVVVANRVAFMIGFVGYGLALNWLVRWLDGRLPQTPRPLWSPPVRRI